MPTKMPNSCSARGHSLSLLSRGTGSVLVMSLLRTRGAEPKCRASEAPPTSPNSHTYPPDQLLPLHRAMLSLLGREARRLPGVRSLVRPSIDSALAGPQVSSQSRLFGTSDLCIYGCYEPSPRRDVRRWAEGGEGEGARGLVHSLPVACTVWEAWRWASPVGKWGESAFSLKVAETMQGAFTAALRY